MYRNYPRVEFVRRAAEFGKNSHIEFKFLMTTIGGGTFHSFDPNRMTFTLLKNGKPLKITRDIAPAQKLGDSGLFLIKIAKDQVPAIGELQIRGRYFLPGAEQRPAKIYEVFHFCGFLRIV